MHEAEDILMSTGAILPLYYYTDPLLAKDYLTGFYQLPTASSSSCSPSWATAATPCVCIASEPDKLDPALNSTVDGAVLAVNPSPAWLT